MIHTCCLNRIKLLLRADWIEHYKKVSFHIGAIIAGMTVYFLLVLSSDKDGSTEKSQQFAFILGMTGTLIYYCRYIGNKIHQPKGLFLTLPANTIEKYMVLLLEGILLLSTFILIFSAGLYIISLIIHFSPLMPWEMQSGLPISIFVFIFSLFFLSYMTFRKHAFVITVGSIAATVVAVIGICASIQYILKNYIVIDNKIPEGWQCFFKGLFNLLANYHDHLLYAATLVVFYLAFRKLKRKELR